MLNDLPPPHKRVPVEQAGEDLPALVEDARQHGPIELTRDGEPVARIVPLDAHQEAPQTREDFVTALERFRAEIDFEADGIDGTEWDDVRDPSPTGRRPGYII